MQRDGEFLQRLYEQAVRRVEFREAQLVLLQEEQDQDLADMQMLEAMMLGTIATPHWLFAPGSVHTPREEITLRLN